MRLLNWGLRKFDTIKIGKKDEAISDLNVWLGKKNKIKVVPAEDIYITIPKRKKKTIRAVIEYDGPIAAPVKKGDVVGLLNIYVSDELKREVDILAAEDIEKLNIFFRIFKSLNYLVWGDV